MRRRIFGVETEYGLTATPPSGGTPMNAERTARQLFELLLHQGRSSNLFLRNDERLYLDVGTHPECATAEYSRLEDLLEQDRAGVSMLADLAVRVDEVLSELDSDLHLRLLRDNLSSQGNSYSRHRDYLLHRRHSHRQVTDTLIVFFVMRQIFVDNGWINTAAVTLRPWLSQRTDQMWGAVSSVTTCSRSIINTRDEALAGSDAYRRIHVVVSDADVAEPTAALGISMTELLIHVIEGSLQIGDLSLADLMRTIRKINSDPSGSAPPELTNRRMTNAIALQREIHKYILARTPVVELDPMRVCAVDLWGKGINTVASGDWSNIGAELDVAIKHRLLTPYCIRGGASITDPRMTWLELPYSDITADGLWGRMERARLMQRLAAVEDVHHAQTIVPTTARAHLHERVIATAKDARTGLSVDWVYVCLDESSTIPSSLQDPLATADPRVDALIARISSQFPTIPA